MPQKRWAPSLPLEGLTLAEHAEFASRGPMQTHNTAASSLLNRIMPISATGYTVA
jgi:hypothetical protein